MGPNKIQLRNAEAYKLLRQVKDDMFALQRDCATHPVFRQMQNRLFHQRQRLEEFFSEHAEIVVSEGEKRMKLEKEKALASAGPKLPKRPFNAKPMPKARKTTPNSLEI